MANSRVDAVLDALKSAFDTAAATLTGVRVYDGPALNLANDKDLIWVGHDGSEDDTAGDAVRTSVDFVGLGTNGRRDERIDVTCAVLTWNGDQDVSLARTRVYDILSACEDQIHNDRTFGVGTPGAPGSVRNGIVSESQLFQANNAGGAKTRVSFTVSCLARL